MAMSHKEYMRRQKAKLMKEIEALSSLDWDTVRVVAEGLNARRKNEVESS